MSDDQAREIKESLKQLFDLSRKQSDQLTSIDKRLVALETEVKLRPVCPSPGLCLKLEPKVETHERAFQQAKGGWWVISVVPTLSSILGAAITYWCMKK